MNPTYLSPFANHLWQSTLFAVVAGLLTLGLRKNRARVRHWVWLVASCKFLIPLSLLIALGGHIRWRSIPETTASKLSVVVDEVSQPFTAPALSFAWPATRPAASPLSAVLFSIWLCGFLGITCAWWIRWRRIRTAVRAGSPIRLEIPISAMSSSTLLEPGVFGVFRPALLLPEGIFDRLTPAQLSAVVEHELCHVRHLDNLIAAIHMFVETVFWFHPLVWWIGKRMIEERERACDEEVVQLGSEPRVYAEGILQICKLYVESPLGCVSGVTGSNLEKRIEAIMKNRSTAELNTTKRAFLAVAGMVAVTAPIVVGVMNAPAIQAQSARAIRPKFVVVFIETCPAAGPAPVPGRKTAAGGRISTSGATFTAECATLRTLIRSAYVEFASGVAWPLDPGSGRPTSPVSHRRVMEAIQQGPGWIDSDRYTIEAKADSAQSREMLRGPMLQTLLENRFQLKVHREFRDVPVFDLKVAPGGARLQAARQGNCLIPGNGPLPEPLPTICGGFTGEYMYGSTIANLCGQLSAALDRDVVDKTGLAGVFDIHFEGIRAYASNATLGAALETTIPKLGLQLEPANASGEFLIIDGAEKPSGN